MRPKLFGVTLCVLALFLWFLPETWILFIPVIFAWLIVSMIIAWALITIWEEWVLHRLRLWGWIDD